MINENLLSLPFDENEDLFSNYFDKLDEAIFFNPQLLSNTDSPIGKLVDEIFPQLNVFKRNKLKEKKDFLNSLITNLALGFRKGLPVAIPKGRNYFTFDKFYGLNHYTYAISTQILHEVEKIGLINSKNGFYNKQTKVGRFTRIQPSQKLKHILTQISQNDFEIENYDQSTIIIKDPLNAVKKLFTKPVILKSPESGVKRIGRKRKEYPIAYKLTTQTNKGIKFLNRYNDFIDTVEILIPINESFLLSLKDESKIKKIQIFLDQLKKVTESFQTLNPITKQQQLFQIYTITNAIQQTSKQYIPKPLLLRKYTDKYLLMSKLNGKLHRIYNRGSFNKGGRFYGGTYQSLNSQQRKNILLNNEPIVELDYSGYHIRMLYHLEGLEYTNDPYDVFDGNSELRELMKVVSLICINARTEGLAVNGIRQAFFTDKELNRIFKKYNFSVKDLIEQFKLYHSSIAKYFFSDKGVDLMFRDSLITEEILKHFLKKKIPCLTVHDSFIVPANYKDELYQAMKETYFKHLHFYPIIK